MSTLSVFCPIFISRTFHSDIMPSSRKTDGEKSKVRKEYQHGLEGRQKNLVDNNRRDELIDIVIIIVIMINIITIIIIGSSSSSSSSGRRRPDSFSQKRRTWSPGLCC